MNHLPFSFSSLFCILLCYCSNLNHSVLASESCDFPAIFNFGDGNSDTGAFTSTFGGGSAPPYGDSFFKPGTSGRASDGRILLDFIATSLGKPFLHPYLESLGANFSTGANFANLLATILPPKLILPISQPPRAFSPFFLDLQFVQFKLFVSQSQMLRTRGGLFKKLLPKTEDFWKALYTIDIGQNDLSQGLFLNMSVEEIKASVPAMINRVSTNVKNLYDLGALTFWIHNTGPIGCLPYILTMVPVSEDQKDGVGCAKPYNELAMFFNSALNDSVNQLRIDLPSAAITYVDIYSARYSLFQNPQKYGFELPLVSCCGLGGEYNFGETSLCGTTVTINGTQTFVGSCEDPSKRISWDGISNSEAADRTVFEMISTGKYSSPPNSLKMACNSIPLKANT